MSTGVLQQLVNGIKSRHSETRMKATRDLWLYIKTELREIPPEDMNAFMNKLNDHILEMMSSNDVNEKKGGILAIQCVIGTADVFNTKTGISRFANILRNHLPMGDPVAMEMAAFTMGKIALVSGTNAATYAEFEVKRAFEWLDRDRNEAKRHAAVLILRELALAMPTYFYQQVSAFFDKIFIAVRDSRALVREGAASALRAALVVIAQRESSKQANKPQWYRQCYDEAINLLDDVNARVERGVTRDDRSHGALLVLNELLRCGNSKWERRCNKLLEGAGISVINRLSEDVAGLSSTAKENPSSSRADADTDPILQTPESAACRQLVEERYTNICTDVLDRISRPGHVQNALLDILPRLAGFNSEKFTKNYLNITIAHLISIIRGRDKERSAGFISTGLLAVAVEMEMKPFIPKILEAIRSAFPSRETPSKKRTPLTPEPAVFACITLLGHAGVLEPAEIVKLLEPILSAGLSTPLTTALRELSIAVPSVRREIGDGLLKILAQILLQRPIRHPGMPRHSRPSISLPEQPDIPSIVLGLRTLGTFDFDGQSLLQFVRRCAEHFLNFEQGEVRLEAVRTSGRLLRIALEGPPSKTVTLTAKDVLSRLLTVAVTDTDPDVRFWVLASLHENFDPHLAQAKALTMLFVCLHDEVFEIREFALSTLGRLSSLNPGYVMPAIRKTLVQLLTELEHSGLARNKEQAAKLLGRLIISAPRLVRPYTEPILSTLVPKLRDSEPVVLSVLKAIGDLAEAAGGTDLLPWGDELLTVLLEIFGDTASVEKRAVALWALGQLVSATGHALQPYSRQPALLDVLLTFLKTEQRPRVRRETLRVLGLLGALDPYKRREPEEPTASTDLTSSEMLISTNASGTLEEYYPAVAVSTLMRIVRDPNLAQHHTMVIQAVTFIFSNLGIKCVPYIPQVFPNFLHMIRTADFSSRDFSSRDFLLQQLAFLVAIVKQHIRNYLDDIFALMKEFWTPNSPLQGTLIYLAEFIAVALGAEFKIYLPQLIPHILRVLTPDPSKDETVVLKMLTALQKFGSTLDDYLHLVLPAVVRLFDAPDCPLAVSKAALHTVDQLADTLDYTDFASRIVHPLIRTLDNNAELRPTAVDTLCAVAAQLGRRYAPFAPLAAKTLAKHRIVCSRHEALVTRAMAGSTLAEIGTVRPTPRSIPVQDVPLKPNDTTTIKRLNVRTANLQIAWAATRRVSKEDWLEWLRRLSIGLIKESPSPALRSCLAVAQHYSQLSRDLFNVAFVSCWVELTEPLQSELVSILEQALMVPDVPEVTQAVLNLAEFMEHCDHGPLPLEPRLLGERAMQCRAYAKALHYKEAEFHAGASSQVVEALISINNKLQQKEAAQGLLEHVMERRDDQLQVQIRWYEKLHSWETALNLYSARPRSDEDAQLGRMRCLEALGEWESLNESAEQLWPDLGESGQQKAGRLAAASAWALGRWDCMERYVRAIPTETQDGAFYRAVLEVHKDEYKNAQKLINTARDLLDTELTAMASESYQRAYGAMVYVQMLAELEEVIQYKLVPERRPYIRAMWWQRLQVGQHVAEDWQRILQVHSLVLSPQEDMHTWLKYASLCRKSGSLNLSHKTLVMLMGIDPSLNPDEPLPNTQPRVTLAYSKHLWMSNKKDLAFNQLRQFVHTYAAQSNVDTRLLARCYLKLGEWQESLQGFNEQSILYVLQCYAAATQHDPSWYKAWHAWAYMNFETVLFYQQQDEPSVHQFTVSAVGGFFHSIKLSRGSSLQDTLRLLTLWFDYGHMPEVCEAIEEGIKIIEINTWLQVIPQLIARIDTPRLPVGRLIHHLLIDIGKSHPQALVYPLTVAASKSTPVARRDAANKILQSMREHSPVLVDQAGLVSNELIRVAILWHELWHEGLEEASRLYFGERDVRGMLAILEPLHAQLEKGPETLKETSFHQAYGRDLQEAHEWCQRYKASRNVRDINQAWDLYYHVFRRISRHIPQLTTLELQFVSPKLLLCRDMELAVPGSYSPGQPIVRIAQIISSLQVIASKQRPRKLCIRGDNGKEYMFLLKGHEDLRQDERVMQLFGLVNTLLSQDPDSQRRNLAIQRYAVIPLSTNSGLIGWVPHCDTLHTLIRDYRDKKKILLNIEHRIMLRMAPDYDHLSLMHKVEVFEHALEHTHGDDLARLLWLKSPSSEAWFDRRCNYTRSLAVMSMVGYILGLGDRHPSNLMLDRLSGKILHIDFGDCFEVAMTREKFPEKIPFRLTRMLVNAMEVTGIEGTYRHTCESVMAVLRRNKDSLMAVLEAFVYDPLLNWRLMDAAGREKRSREAGDLSGVAVANSQETNILTGSPPVPPSSATPATEAESIQPEALSKKAVTIVNRVKDKLTGHDFQHDEALTIKRQVDLLIQQATSNENLCQCYIGWCPFW
ncbi:serine/threonine-protein kinase Tor [Chrysoperla carnea]|nr:serine/threonine-protein kinase Tor [Chrysoperla carnea]